MWLGPRLELHDIISDKSWQWSYETQVVLIILWINFQSTMTSWFVSFSTYPRAPVKWTDELYA
jgi:hypothetical protein